MATQDAELETRAATHVLRTSGSDQARGTIWWLEVRGGQLVLDDLYRSLQANDDVTKMATTFRADEVLRSFAGEARVGGWSFPLAIDRYRRGLLRARYTDEIEDASRIPHPWSPEGGWNDANISGCDGRITHERRLISMGLLSTPSFEIIVGLSGRRRAGGMEKLSGGFTGWKPLTETRRNETWQQETVKLDRMGCGLYTVYEKRDGRFRRLELDLSVEDYSRLASAGDRRAETSSKDRTQWKCLYCGGSGHKTPESKMCKKHAMWKKQSTAFAPRPRKRPQGSG